MLQNTIDDDDDDDNDDDGNINDIMRALPAKQRDCIHLHQQLFVRRCNREIDQHPRSMTCDIHCGKLRMIARILLQKSNAEPGSSRNMHRSGCKLNKGFAVLHKAPNRPAGRDAARLKLR